MPARRADPFARPDKSDRQAHRWHLVRVGLAVGYGLGAAAYIVLVKLPTDRNSLSVAVIAALAVRCVGRNWRSYVQVVIDWFPFIGILILYDKTRGIADDLGIPVHVRVPADFDAWLGGGTLPSYFLQQHLYTPGVTHWYDACVTLVYTSHFLAMPTVGAVLWMRNRPAWGAFIRRIIAMSVIGLGGYILYPAAPPWYAGQQGVVPPLIRLSSRGWFELRMPHAGDLLAGAQAGANAVAAVPSLHTATATIVTVFLVPRVWKWLRPIIALYPLAMGFVLVYAGEHYIFDVLLGYLTALIVLVGVSALERWWRNRESRDAVASGAAEPAT